MANINPGVINYTMFEGSEEYVGLAQVTLPSLQFMTQEVAGAGIMGRITAAMIAQLNTMQIQIQMLTLTEQGIKLTEHRVHTWEFREAQQTVDDTSGEHGVEEVKHIIKAFPTGMDGGTLQPQSVSNANLTAQVYYWAEYRDGKKVLELDPFNYICFINGKDYADDVKKALGKGSSSGNSSDSASGGSSTTGS